MNDNVARTVAIVAGLIGALRPLLALGETRAVMAPLPDRQAVIRACAAGGEGTWRRTAGPAENLSARSLFTYALSLCEAQVHLERLPRLIELGAKMQDRQPGSNTYGNFRWYWREDKPHDRNAVDFCMLGGALLWQRHRDRLPAETRKILRETLEYGVEGCLRHRVPSSYTNIALLNALDLILLGEGIGHAKATEEGYARLDRFCLYTWRWGVHEYCSPTYYGVDVECLLMIEAFAKRERGRTQARAMLELFWTDIALNWYPGCNRLGGACSRDYRYLTGTGHLDSVMWLAGWLPGKQGGGIFPALGRWQPPERLWRLNRTRFPRLVQQWWGPERSQYRTSYLCKDVGLSVAGANYSWMDLPLTVDLPGRRNQPRCYFIPDGRGDPYGTKRIPAGPHSKARHLRPFWAAAQRRTDALGLAVYRRGDVPPGTSTLESHFVMRRGVEGFWIGDRRVDVSGDAPVSFAVPNDTPVVLRDRTAAVGVRAVWSRAIGDRRAAVSLVYDGNKHDAVRLTVAHQGAENTDVREAAGRGPSPGVALWVRIGTGLETPQAFDAWRRAFADAMPTVRAGPDNVRIQVAGLDGPIALAASEPYRNPNAIVPTPPRVVLALDGEDLGREILEHIEPITTYERRLKDLPTVTVRPQGGTYLEAEAGLVLGSMTVAEDPAASGGRYVWLPGEPGERGGGPTAGSATWRLQVEHAGQVALWGRILAPTPDDDSFFVGVSSEDVPPLDLTAWHTGVHKAWAWTPMRPAGSRKPLPLTLPKGVVWLELRGREDGAMIDKLFIAPSDDPAARPVD